MNLSNGAITEITFLQKRNIMGVDTHLFHMQVPVNCINDKVKLVLTTLDFRDYWKVTDYGKLRKTEY